MLPHVCAICVLYLIHKTPMVTMSVNKSSTYLLWHRPATVLVGFLWLFYVEALSCWWGTGDWLRMFGSSEHREPEEISQACVVPSGWLLIQREVTCSSQRELELEIWIWTQTTIKHSVFYPYNCISLPSDTIALSFWNSRRITGNLELGRKRRMSRKEFHEEFWLTLKWLC